MKKGRNDARFPKSSTREKGPYTDGEVSVFGKHTATVGVTRENPHSAQAVETLFVKKRRKTRKRARHAETSERGYPDTEEIVAASGFDRLNTKRGNRAIRIQ